MNERKELATASREEKGGAAPLVQAARAAGRVRPAGAAAATPLGETAPGATAAMMVFFKILRRQRACLTRTVNGSPLTWL